MKLIDKAAVVAEIEKKLDKHNKLQSFNYGAVKDLESLLNFLDTLEVKEVDLDVEQRMKECPHRQVGCTMHKGHILECNGACSWVVDYPKLKELKTQKGE